MRGINELDSLVLSSKLVNNFSPRFEPSRIDDALLKYTYRRIITGFVARNVDSILIWEHGKTLLHSLQTGSSKGKRYSLLNYFASCIFWSSSSNAYLSWSLIIFFQDICFIGGF